jgi:hypothetical protein
LFALSVRASRARVKKKQSRLFLLEIGAGSVPGAFVVFLRHLPTGDSFGVYNTITAKALVATVIVPVGRPFCYAKQGLTAWWFDISAVEKNSPVCFFRSDG